MRRRLERERCWWQHSAHSSVGGPAARVAASHLIPPGLSGERGSPRAHLTTGRVPTGSAGPPAWLVGRPEAAEALRETRPKRAEGDPSSRLRRVNGMKPRGAATGRRPDAFGAVYVTFTHREGPEPTPPSRNGRVTADFQRSIHLLGFRVRGAESAAWLTQRNLAAQIGPRQDRGTLMIYLDDSAPA